MIFFTRQLAFAAMLSTVLIVPARADGIKAGDLVITQPWSRATPGGAKVAGGYLTIENKGTTPDKFIGGSLDAASSLEIHEMATTNGVMTMRPIDSGLTIAPGKTVTFAPGGYHLMFMGLKGALKQGDKLPVTLQFEKAGKITVSFEVQSIGAQGIGAQTPGATPAQSGMKGMHDHSGMKM